MATVALLLGGNIGDVAERFDSAHTLLEQRVGRITSRSQRYTTEPWGFSAESAFLNEALTIECQLEPEALLDITQEIEQQLGRCHRQEREIKRSSGERYCSRTLDIDILLWGERMITTPRLTIPHKELAGRKFALEPLAEILPEAIEPRMGITIKEMAQRL